MPTKLFNVLAGVFIGMLLVGPVGAQEITRSRTARQVKLANSVYMTGRNAAGTADVNMWRVNGTDQIESGAATVTVGGFIAGAASVLSLTATNSVQAGASGNIYFLNRALLGSPADALMNVSNNAITTVGYQINTGTAAPSVTTCGTGAIAAHSNNMAGSFSTTGATTCTLTFGAPAWTFTPFCTFTEKTTAGSYRISAESTTAVTITGFTSGDSFTYTCGGGSI